VTSADLSSSSISTSIKLLIRPRSLYQYNHTYSLMMNGRNNGKKIMAVRIVQHAFEIIHLVTEQNPVQVLGTCL
jgi:ribosomal protein S7